MYVSVPDNIFVVELLQKGYFSYCGAGNSFRFAVTTVVLRLKRVRLFRELQGTCQVVVCQLSAFWRGYGMLYNRGL